MGSDSRKPAGREAGLRLLPVLRSEFEVGTHTRPAGSFTVTVSISRAKWQWVHPDLGFFTGRSEREIKG